MPESKGRKKREYVAPSARLDDIPPSPPWFAPVMVTLMIIGLIWTVIFYLAPAQGGGSWPIPGIGNWNLIIGFGLIFSGFIMATRWR